MRQGSKLCAQASLGSRQAPPDRREVPNAGKGPTAYLTLMLSDIRRIFRRSLDAFWAEVRAREPEDQVAELLLAMRREMVAAKATISEQEEALARTAGDLERERQALAECDRRRALADRIRDQETARIAGEFAVRHRERVIVLERRFEAAQAELTLRRREADEMRTKYQHADANRFALLAQLRQAQRRGRDSPLSADNDAFDDLARMAERVEYESGAVDALGEIEDRPSAEKGDAAQEVEERLRMLKRQLNRE